jgi:uncharacterized protein involved in exopolysaccharide biosynthesis
MTAPSVDDDITLRDYWRILVRRRILILGRGNTAAVRVRL